MTFDQLIGGIETLRPFYKDQNGYHCGAEHDIFYLYATDRPLTPEAVKRMEQLEWFQEGVAAEGDEWTAADYDPDEGWAQFT